MLEEAFAKKAGRWHNPMLRIPILNALCFCNSFDGFGNSFFLIE
jgi:hypothetical protein